MAPDVAAVPDIIPPVLEGFALKAALFPAGLGILCFTGFALKDGLRPGGFGKPLQLTFGSRRRPRFGITALRLPHFLILPMSSSSSRRPAVKPLLLTIGYSGSGQKRRTLSGQPPKERSFAIKK
ncbi:hypothetical protein C2I18_07060 [Paenibacillus sp. PK3_47]|nr:hypothetical protein C2I18_07060 [Paenibacillus sp. PK3_47]